MTTDYRALCAEIIDAHDADEGMLVSRWTANLSAVINRARAALAQPEPVAPTVMEIIELHSWLEDEWRANNDGEDLPMLDYARAVLNRYAHTSEGG